MDQNQKENHMMETVKMKEEMKRMMGEKKGMENMRYEKEAMQKMKTVDQLKKEQYEHNDDKI